MIATGVCVGDAVGEVRHSWFAKPHCRSSTGTPMFIAMACIIARAASVPDHCFCLYLDGIACTMQMLRTLRAESDVDGLFSESFSVSSESVSDPEPDPDPFSEREGLLVGSRADDGDMAVGRTDSRLKPREGTTPTLLEGLEDGCNDK